jgi:hypothetical protein
MARQTERHEGHGAQGSKQGAEVDYVEAEHDPAASRKASDAGIQRMLGPRIRRKASGAEPAKDPAEAQHAAPQSGAPLPADARGRFEASLGTDLSAVRVHTGAASATAADAVGAKAYATGQDIHFASGAYDPSSKEGQHLLAHEVAHTVQQSGAESAGAQFKLDVSQPGDSHEVEADRAADAMVDGKSATVSAGAAGQSVQRKPATEAMADRYDALDEKWQNQRDAVADPVGAHVLDGGSNKATDIADKHAGDAGYAAKLGKAGTQHAQEAMAKGDYGVIAPTVEPYTLRLDEGIVEQGQWIETKEKEKEDSKYTPSTARDFFTLGLTQTGKDPDWVTKEKENSVTRAGAQMQMLERHMFEQDLWVNSYNSWAPVANEAHSARADLIESAALMGFDLGKTGDMVKFVEGIEHGLDNATSVVDAKVLGAGEASWSDRQAYKGDVGAGPELEGDSIEGEFGHLRAAYEAVNLAHRGIYTNLLEARTAILQQNKAGKEGKVAEINATIQFVTDMSGVVESGVTWANTGPAAFDAKLNQFAGEWRARYAEHKAVKASHDGHHAASRFNQDRAQTIRDTSTTVEPSPGGAPTLSGMLGALATASYQDELHTLQGQITSLSKGIDAKNAVAALNATEGRIQTYQSARAQLARVAQRLQVATMAKREAQYLKAGDALDRYALAHGSKLKAQKKGDLVPKDNKHEVYSSLMVMVAKIRAYMLLSDSARDMFDYDAFVDRALTLVNERRNPDVASELQSAPSNVHWQPPRVPKMNKQENHQVWEAIDSTYAAVFGFSERARIQFGGVEDKVTKLLQKMKGVESKTNDVAENKY